MQNKTEILKNGYNNKINLGNNPRIAQEKYNNITLFSSNKSGWKLFEALNNDPDTLDNQIIALRGKVDDSGKVITQGTAFNLQTHRAILEQAVKEAEANLSALQNRDLTIMVSGTVAIISYFIIPMWFVAVATTAICAWSLAKRKESEANHQRSLKQLAQVWEWAMNDPRCAASIKEDALIKQMRRALFPLISEEDANLITDNTEEKEQLDAAHKDQQNMTVKGVHISKEAGGLYHKIYGANQEGFSAMAKGILGSLLVGFYRVGVSAYNFVTSTNNSHSPK